jgi:hypothetical protein
VIEKYFSNPQTFSISLIYIFQISVKLKVKIGGNGRSGSPCLVVPQQSAISKYANTEKKLVRKNLCKISSLECTTLCGLNRNESLEDEYCGECFQLSRYFIRCQLFIIHFFQFGQVWMFSYRCAIGLVCK